MSTKALQKMLHKAKRGDAIRVLDAYDAARELKAIHEMARVIAGKKLDPDELRRAAELMQSIAKDAP